MTLRTKISELINAHPVDESKHLLIMAKHSTGKAVWAYYPPLPFSTMFIDGIRALFDENYATLDADDNHQVNAQLAPIIMQIGGYRVTVIEQLDDGNVTCWDGLDESVDSHMGVGGA